MQNQTLNYIYRFLLLFIIENTFFIFICIEGDLYTTNPNSYQENKIYRLLKDFRPCEYNKMYHLSRIGATSF